jgi:hypothetical protein
VKYTRRILLGLYIFIAAFSFVSLGGCITGDYRGYDRGDRHYYRDGRWYRHDPRGNEIVVDSLGVGVFVESLPPQHAAVVVQGAQYYHDDRYYYRQAPKGGYVVVQAPAAVQSQPKNNHDERGGGGNNSRNEGPRGENH